MCKKGFFKKGVVEIGVVQKGVVHMGSGVNGVALCPLKTEGIIGLLEKIGLPDLYCCFFNRPGQSEVLLDLTNTIVID